MSDTLDLVKAASTDVAQRYFFLQGAITARNDLIVAAYRTGISQADLAAAAGLSPQRIHQLVYDQEEPANGQHH